MNGDTVALLHAPGAQPRDQLANNSPGLVVGNGARGIMDIDVDLYQLEVFCRRGEKKFEKRKLYPPSEYYRFIMIVGRVRKDIGDHIGAGHRGPGCGFKNHARWKKRKDQGGCEDARMQGPGRRMLTDL